MFRTIPRRTALLSICLFMGCGTRQPDVDLRVSGATDATDARMWLICRATSEGQLVFAVFEGGPRKDRSLKSSVVMNNNENRNTVRVTRPDGSILKLPANVKLVEIIDGQYKESSERVSLQDFEAFLESKPDVYTIDNLLRFADTRLGPR